MGKYRDAGANDLVRAICSEACARMGLTLPFLELVELAKATDLGDSAAADLVERISQLVYRDDDDVRADVVFALCGGRPVPGYEWVAVEGWKRATPLTIHWISSSMTKCFLAPAQINPHLVALIAERAFDTFVVRDGFSSPDDEYDYRTEFGDRMMFERSIMEVMDHFLAVLRDVPPPPAEWPTLENRQWPINWRTVAEVFHLSVTRTAGSASPDCGSAAAGGTCPARVRGRSSEDHEVAVYRDAGANDLVLAICSEAATRQGLDPLLPGFVWLAKETDLRDPAVADLVERISQLVYCDDDQLREDVVFALCLFRPVPGYEWVAVEGWKRATPATIHWMASSITVCFLSPKQIEPQLVALIADRALDEWVIRETFSNPDEAYDYQVAFCDRMWIETSTMDVMEHFLTVLRGETPPRAPGLARLFGQRPVDWRTVAEVFHLSVTRTAGPDSPNAPGTLGG